MSARRPVPVLSLLGLCVFAVACTFGGIACAAAQRPRLGFTCVGVTIGIGIANMVWAAAVASDRSIERRAVDG